MVTCLAHHSYLMFCLIYNDVCELKKFEKQFRGHNLVQMLTNIYLGLIWTVSKTNLKISIVLTLLD